MKQIARLIILLAVLTVFPMLLISCNGSDENQNNTTGGSSLPDSTENDTVGTVDGIPLVVDGVSKVTIIYPQANNDIEFSSALSIVDKIKDVCGVKPEMKSDKTDPIDGTLEILIGDTSHTPFDYYSVALTKGTYLILVEENKIIINGSTSSLLRDAVKKFLGGIVEQNGAVLDKNVSGSDYSEPFRKELFKYGSNDVERFEELEENYYMLYFSSSKAITQDDFSDYYHSLIDAGMETLEAPRNMLGNENAKYAVCEKDGWTFTIISTFNNKQTRVFIERKEDNGYFSYVNETTEKICEPLFLQVGTGIQSGMCYIFRFSNGTFFIVDGGMDDSYADYAALKNGQRIISTLKQYAPDPANIRVVGWLITHPHIDHIGSLQYFCKNLSKYPEVKVENLLYNNYSTAVLAEDSEQNLVSKVAEYNKPIKELLNTGTKLHRTHTGQLLSFGENATLEIAYTHEMRMGYNKLTSGNGLSIVMRFTVEGQTFLLTGDTTTNSNKVMEKIYGVSLRSDFYQTPHHGWGGNTNTLAELVNPRWVLWPCNSERYDIVKSKTHNKFLFNALSRVEGHYVAENKTYVFSLPFNGTNVTVTENK